MKILFFILINGIILMLATTAYSFFEYRTINARLLSVGGKQAAFLDSVSANHINPALNNFNEKIKLVASYNNPFGAKFLHSGMISVRGNSEKHGFSLHLNSLNYKTDYFEKELNVSYARKILKNLQLGIGLSYYYVGAPGYKGDISFLQSDTSLGMHLGVFKRYKKIDMGFAVRNINSPSMKLSKNTQTDTSLPASTVIGVAYRPLKDVWSGVSANISDGEIQLYGGVEVKVGSILALRMGGNRNFFNFGAGVNVHNVNLDITMATHEFLGLNYKVSFGYEF